MLLVGGKLAVMAAIGPMFGMTKLAAIRAGLLIAPGEGRGNCNVWKERVRMRGLWCGEGKGGGKSDGFKGVGIRVGLLITPGCGGEGGRAVGAVGFKFVFLPSSRESLAHRNRGRS